MMFRLFARGIWSNVLGVFARRNIFFHALAIGCTAALVLSGADWRFFEITRSPSFTPLIFLAGIGGFFVPVLLPVGLYIFGEWKANRRALVSAAAGAQAVIIALSVSSFYKVFTGRIQPEFLASVPGVDISREFHFGFLQHGIFWGWPSSHAAVACALATALFVFYKHRPAVLYPVLLYALVVVSGAAIGFHWLSDVVAGMILGILVGFVVGQQAAQVGENNVW